MKIFRYLLLAVLFLGCRAIAHAYAVVINDPTTSTLTPFNVMPGVPFSFDFTTCNVTVDGIPMMGCAEGKNDSKVTLTNIILTYESTLGGTPVCTSNAFDKTTCGLTNEGTEFELSFVDHPPSDANGCDGDADHDDLGCGVPPGHFFYIYESQTAGSAFPSVDGIANTPEPSSIWLALSGLGSAGYLIRRRRKNLTV